MYRSVMRLVWFPFEALPLQGKQRDLTTVSHSVRRQLIKLGQECNYNDNKALIQCFRLCLSGNAKKYQISQKAGFVVTEICIRVL